MAKGKYSTISKVLLKDEHVEKLEDMFDVISKQVFADAMKIDKRTLNNRLENFGEFTFENWANLGESLEINEAQTILILTSAFKEYLKERKKNPQKKDK